MARRPLIQRAEKFSSASGRLQKNLKYPKNRKDSALDDSILAAQLAKTGNLMDICNTPEWLEELREDNEFDCAGKIGAALDGPYVKAVSSLTAEQIKDGKQQVRLLSILFVELSDWLKTWDLGIGFEEVYIVARRIVREHLQALTPKQQSWVDELLLEDQVLQKGEEKPIRQQTKAMLAELFTDEDWQVMAEKAAQTAKNNILQVSQVEPTESETAEAA